MALVDFSRIKRVRPQDAAPMDGGNGAMGATVIDGRPTLYDPVWGYFIFGQSIRFNYQDTDVYQETGTFTIQGVFTPNAERVAADNDHTAFTALIAKYEALHMIFEKCKSAEAPSDYADWGTAADLRTLALPAPLVDQEEKTIRALPEEMTLEPGTFAGEIHYRATLKEARFPLAKLVLNGQIVDNGVIDFSLPRPEFASHKIVGTSGEILQLKHYKPLGVSVALTLPLPEGAITPNAKDLGVALQVGVINLQTAVQSPGGSVEVVDIGQFSVSGDASIQTDYRNGQLSVQFSAIE